MSILFEAWRRAHGGGSQWSRTLGAAPTVTLRRHSPLLPWLLGALFVALAAALGVFVWLVYGQAERRTAAASPTPRVVTKTAIAPPAAQAPSIRSTVSGAVAQAGAGASPRAAQAAPQTPAPQTEQERSAQAGASANEEVGSEPPPGAVAKTRTDVHSSPAQPVTLAMLPASVRRDFPALGIVAHVWNADPNLRFVVAGGQRLRVGEEIVPGVRLLEITRRGEVVAFRGYRIVLP